MLLLVTMMMMMQCFGDEMLVSGVGDC